MTNYTAKILNNAVSALNAQQAIIATTANNISNVDTPGYARRTVDLETRSSRGTAGTVNVGSGVAIGDVQRVSDAFVDQIVQQSTSDSGSADVQMQYLNQMQQSFNLTGTGATIGDSLSSFFASANQLSGDPSNVDLRSTFIQSANNLVSSISTTYNSLATLQTQADQQVQTEVSNVNTILTKIGQLNSTITQSAGTGQPNDDAQDQMSQLLNSLSGEMNYSMVRQQDGSVMISMPNGFNLVNGANVNQLSTTTTPSFGSSGVKSLGGGLLSSIVFDYSGGANTQDIDLTQQITGGKIGGLLATRGVGTPASPPSGPASAFSASGSLVQVASQVESVARTLLTSVNTTYNGTAANPSVDLNGTVQSGFSLFTFTGAPSAAPTTATLNATGINNFASILSVKPTDPTDIAAATDQTTPPAAVSFSPGDGTNMATLAQFENASATNLVAVGNYNPAGNQTLDDSYNTTVTTVGNIVSAATLNQQVANGNLTNAQSQQSSVSGVSLDEEFTNLITSQKAYQAAARMLSVGQELLDDIIKAI